MSDVPHIEVSDDIGSDWYELSCLGCGEGRKRGLYVEIDQQDGFENAKAAAIAHVKSTGHEVRFNRVECYEVKKA